MNITHSTQEVVNGDRLKAIFDRQKELMEKYHHIEKRSGLLQTDDCPVDLDDKRGQARLKDFSWRFIEEVGEALDARSNELHYQEELIDGLHFLTELTILAGRDYDTITEFEVDSEELDYLDMFYDDGRELAVGLDLDKLITKLVQDLGMTMNCLKNKPWKQSHMRTDKEMFYNRLEKVWLDYMGILAVAGLEAKDIVDIYLKKSQVNGFRIRSKY